VERSQGIGKAGQNTDRIARTVLNVAVCRTFLRSVLSIVYRPQGPLPTALESTARGSTAWK
jgi:hypothetical protein